MVSVEDHLIFMRTRMSVSFFFYYAFCHSLFLFLLDRRSLLTSKPILLFDAYFVSGTFVSVKSGKDEFLLWILCLYVYILMYVARDIFSIWFL